MILADTSIWIDHFREPRADLEEQASRKNLLMHPYVVAEFSLGSLHQRSRTIAWLDGLPSARIARLEDVRNLIELRSLHSRGIGLVDAHLLASTLLHGSCRLWTRDQRLRAAAEDLGVSADLS